MTILQLTFQITLVILAIVGVGTLGRELARCVENRKLRKQRYNEVDISQIYQNGEPVKYTYKEERCNCMKKENQTGDAYCVGTQKVCDAPLKESISEDDFKNAITTICKYFTNNIPLRDKYIDSLGRIIYRGIYDAIQCEFCRSERPNVIAKQIFDILLPIYRQPKSNSNTEPKIDK